MEDVRSEARRGEQGQSGGRRKHFAPQVSHALQAGRCRIVDESSPMGALVIVESSTGERGEAFVLSRASYREHGDQERTGKRAGTDRGRQPGKVWDWG